MTRVWPRVMLLGVIGSAAVPARGRAQPAPAPASDVNKTQVARQYTAAGLDAAKLGDYDTAINFYQKAYQLVPHPTLIFNIAEAHRLAGRIDQALTLYRRYLSEAPNGPQASDAHDRIAKIEKDRADEARKAEDARKAEEARKAEDARKAEEARKAEADRKAEDARKADEARKTEDDSKAAAATPPSGAPGATSPADTGAPEPAHPGRGLRIAGIVVGVGGLIGLGDSIRWAIRGSSLQDDVMRQFDMGKVNAGDHANTVAYEALGIGSALVAAGAALYWWGYTQDRPAEHMALAPVVSGQGVGLVVAGTWR